LIHEVYILNMQADSLSLVLNTQLFVQLQCFHTVTMETAGLGMEIRLD